MRADGTEVADGDNNPATWGVFIPNGPGVPVLADLDGEPGLELIVAKGADLVAVDITGQALSGFPVSVADYTYEGARAVADLDRDGQLEIVAARVHRENTGYTNPAPTSQYLEVRGAGGALKPGWPQSVTFAYDIWHGAAPVIADVDWARFTPSYAAARPRPLLDDIPEAKAALDSSDASAEPDDALRHREVVVREITSAETSVARVLHLIAGGPEA